MDEKTVVTTLASVLLAVSGYLAAHASKLRLDQRTSQLNRINTQLSDFYGPLLALGSATSTAWLQFRKKYRPGRAFFGEGAPPTEQELVAWRTWMKEVFMPSNLRMAELVTTKSDLLIEDHIPPCLLTLCAHVAAYQAVMKRWEEKDFSEHSSLVNFPTEVLDYAHKSFLHLKAEQSRLLGLVNKRRLI
ncbi:hypothetical protein [Archangium lipolyticum]|uniref:hypothetical protein n=1 Tax=Archangium lipolyticum TaxID=2970465 RepID=UPI00214CB84D|nr:hypothetical protein [Archangium lipolyticum]